MDPRRSDYLGVKLEGKTPVGAVLTVGRAPGQTPIEKDRFYIHDYPSATRSFKKKSGAEGSAERRELSTNFRAFNLESSGGVDIYANPMAEARGPGISTFRGTIVHAERSLFTNSGFVAYRLQGKIPGTTKPWPSPPGKQPACRGNSRTALRYFGGEGDDAWKEVPCPGDLCEFRQRFETPGGYKIVPCSLKTWLLFNPRWTEPHHQGLAVPLMLWDTKSRWNSAPGLVGMLDEVEGIAASLGLSDVTWTGFPFVMTLGSRTSPQDGTRYPVVTFAWEGDPVEVLRQQALRRRMATHALAEGAGPALLTMGDLAEAGELDIDAMAPATAEPVSAAAIPAVVVVPATLPGSPAPTEAPGQPVNLEARNLDAERRELAKEARALSATVSEAGDLLSRILGTEGAPGPKHTRELSLAQIDAARARLAEIRAERAKAITPEQASLDLPGARVTLNGGQIAALREEAYTEGVSFDEFEAAYLGGPVASYLGEPGENERSIELRLLGEIRRRAKEAAA